MLQKTKPALYFIYEHIFITYYKLQKVELNCHFEYKDISMLPSFCKCLCYMYNTHLRLIVLV